MTLGVFDLTAIHDVLARSNGRRGTKRLRAAIAGYREPLTRRELERLFLELVRKAGLPMPLVNQWLSDKEVDFVWPEQRLIVEETDGYRVHGGHNAFRNDRRRDRDLQRDGWRVIRFTWADVTDDPDEVVRTLEAFLR